MTCFVLVDPGFCGEDHLLSGGLLIEGLTVKDFKWRETIQDMMGAIVIILDSMWYKVA